MHRFAFEVANVGYPYRKSRVCWFKKVGEVGSDSNEGSIESLWFRSLAETPYQLRMLLETPDWLLETGWERQGEGSWLSDVNKASIVAADMMISRANMGVGKLRVGVSPWGWNWQDPLLCYLVNDPNIWGRVQAFPWSWGKGKKTWIGLGLREAHDPSTNPTLSSPSSSSVFLWSRRRRRQQGKQTELQRMFNRLHMGFKSPWPWSRQDPHRGDRRVSWRNQL